MTPAQKIKSFFSQGELLQAIDADRITHDNSAQRYPVRFILFDNFNVAKDFVAALRKRGCKFFELETMLPDTDRDCIITNDELFSKIRSTPETMVISPVSEIVRFYAEKKFIAFFETLSLLELPESKSRRIYIPLIGLSRRFEKFLEVFFRIAESAPIWRLATGETQCVEIFIVSPEFPVPEKELCLKTFYDWLVFWKRQAPQEKVLVSSDVLNCLYHNSEPDNIFGMRKIETEKHFLENFLNYAIPIDYVKSDAVFWRELLTKIYEPKCRGFNFKAFVNDFFNIRQLELDDVLNEWIQPTTKNFARWLLKNYFLQYLKTENSYFSVVMESILDNWNPVFLVERITLAIFETERTSEKIAERKKLLEMIGDAYRVSTPVKEELNQRIEMIAETNVEEAIELCFGRCPLERESLLRWYAAGQVPPDRLTELYPDLAAYLELNPVRTIPYDEKQQWANEYFNAYRNAKVKDVFLPEIKEFISVKNKSEKTFWNWYHTFEKTENLLHTASVSADKIFWLDGVGAEFLPLILSLVEQSEFSVEELKIATVKIPSSTEFNKPAIQNMEKKDDLDAFIHREPYRFLQKVSREKPTSICREIEIVREIFEEILRQTNPVRLVLVSDHGLTALSRLVDSRRYNYPEVSHDGRYAEIPNGNSLPDSDYVRYTVDGKYFHVALTHTSLDTKPLHEAHGGCTPEEILVPFLVISNRTPKKNTVRPSRPISSLKPVSVPAPKPNKGFEEDDLF